MWMDECDVSFRVIFSCNQMPKIAVLFFVLVNLRLKFEIQITVRHTNTITYLTNHIPFREHLKIHSLVDVELVFVLVEMQ